MEPLLSVTGLTTRFTTRRGMVTAVDGVDFSIKKGEILGVVGESGCGKSVTSLSILRLLPENGKIADGQVLFDGVDLSTLSEEEMCHVRGNRISMIFQDPLTSLNPTMLISDQLCEPFVTHQGCNKAEARRRSLEMLRKVGIPSPERRMNEYPHQLSGGMRQRVMIAMALSCNPSLLVADEPTTALDVSIQAQILELMRGLRDDLGAAILLITHDLGVIAEMADNVLVMYAGNGVEWADADSIFHRPLHPYTKGLLRSIPRLDSDDQVLYSIPGTVPNQYDMPPGCRFAPRCPNRMEICRKELPGRYRVGGSVVSCFLYQDADESGDKNEDPEL